MKAFKPSWTAELVAACRAAESLKPEQERACHDCLAKDFLGAGVRFVAECRLLRKVAIWYCERLYSGLYTYVVERTRYVDDCLMSCIDQGINQLVILGADYDTRAYRFDELRGNVTVFEVDYPDTQRIKLEKVRRIPGSLPDDVVYVPIHLDREKLDQALFENGYKKYRKTLFIFECATMYLTEEATHEILAFAANNSGKGSSIVVDYVFQPVEGLTSRVESAGGTRRPPGRIDPTDCELEAQAIDEFLSERSLRQATHITGVLKEAACFEVANHGGKTSGFRRIVHAIVNPAGKDV